MGGGVGRHRSAHEPEAWLAGLSSQNTPGWFHHSLGRSQSAPPVSPPHMASARRLLSIIALRISPLPLYLGRPTQGTNERHDSVFLERDSLSSSDHLESSIVCTLAHHLCLRKHPVSAITMVIEACAMPGSWSAIS